LFLLLLCFLPSYLVVVYYADFCVFCSVFYSRAAVSVVFHLAVLFRFYHLLDVVPFIVSSEQNKDGDDDGEDDEEDDDDDDDDDDDGEDEDEDEDDD